MDQGTFALQRHFVDVPLGTGDIFFDVKWSHWLARTIPGTRRRVELPDARLFQKEERASELNTELRAFWQTREDA